MMGEDGKKKSEYTLKPCYCISQDCPYHDCCESSANSVGGRTADGAVYANLNGICKRYAWWVGNRKIGGDKIERR